jgi:FixJ family two-component response regulator
LRLSGEDGIEIMERLLSQPHFHLPVIILTGYGSIAAAVQCMKLGAIEFFEKPINSDALIAKVRAAIAIDIRRCEERNATEAARDRVHALSPKERELVVLISQGLTSKQIATRLGISIKTVDNRRARAIEKVSASNSAELVNVVMHSTVSDSSGGKRDGEFASAEHFSAAFVIDPNPPS